MKPYLIFSVVMLVFASHMNAQENDWLNANLKGKVRTVKETRYNMYEKKWYPAELSDFNAAGNKIKRTVYTSEGEIMSRDEHSFNVLGQKTELIYYDGNGRIETRINYFYDTRGQVIRLLQKDEIHQEVWENYIRYDRDGLRVADSSFMNGEPDKKTIYSYDNKRNCILAITYNSRGAVELIESNAYLYDESENLKSRTEQTGWGKTITYSYVNGRLRSQQEEGTTMRGWNESATFTTLFNNLGDKEKLTGYYHDSPGQPINIRYEYEYDVYGNWTACNSVDEKGAKAEFRKREIFYY